MDIMVFEKEKLAIISARLSKENAWHYTVRPKDRWNALDSWKYCQSIGYPLNTMIEMEFPQAQDPSLDVLKIRRLTHYCRIYVKQILGLEHYSMWGRHVARGQTVEKDILLISVPDEHFDKFKDIAEGWKFHGVPAAVKVTRVDYSRCIERDGQFYTTFEVMTRNLDPITRRAEPASCYEPSEPIFRPVLFYSIKVDKAMRQGKVPIVMIDG